MPHSDWLVPAASTSIALLLAIAVAYTYRKKSPVLHPVEWREFELVEKRPISHNTAIYRFALPHPRDVLGLPIGQHISVAAMIDGKQVTRSYTPISSDDDCGFFELMVKSYPTGNVSKMFSQLQLGDGVRMRGPKGAFRYEPNMVKHMVMICGGTGLTPMLQIARAILKNPLDRTKVTFIFANVNKEDILLRRELDAMADQNDAFTLHYVLNNPPETWKGGVGFVTADMIQAWCPEPSQDVKILICGPPPMVKAVAGHCDSLGYEKPRAISKMQDQVFKF